MKSITLLIVFGMAMAYVMVQVKSIPMPNDEKDHGGNTTEHTTGNTTEATTEETTEDNTEAEDNDTTDSGDGGTYPMWPDFGFGKGHHKGGVSFL